MTERTKGPWGLISENLRGGKYWTVLRPGMDNAEAICIHDDDNGEADAAAIVRWENHFDELVEALSEIETMPCSMVNDSESLRHTIKTLRAIATAALRKAKS